MISSARNELDALVVTGVADQIVSSSELVFRPVTPEIGLSVGTSQATLQTALAQGLTLAAGANIAKLQAGLADIFAQAQVMAMGLSGATRTAALTGFASTNALAPITAGYVTIDAAAQDGNGANLLASLEVLGLQGGASVGATVSGRIPIDAIDDIAALANLAFARPSYMMTNTGSVQNQADTAMHTDWLRGIGTGLTGSGITVGVLSDSFNTRTTTSIHYANDVATGDLPSGVNIVQDFAGGTDEGRAMAQLIYDVAPGAQLAFATAQNGQAGFAQNIAALSSISRIVVDDIIYFAEPFFSDGIIAKAVDAAVASGDLYFSSASNYAASSYQATFVDSGQTYTNPTTGIVYRLHDFDTTTGVDVTQRVTQNGNISYVLQWDQPFFSVNPATGGSVNDLVLIFRQPEGTVLRIADDSNVGKDPIEITSLNGTGSFDISIGVRVGTVDPGLIKYVALTQNFTQNEYDTASSTAYGHNNAAGAIAVAAAPFYGTPAYDVNLPKLENFSSRGGTPILFDANGIRLATPIIRGIDITAPDGGNTTFFGADSPLDADTLPNFFGTSAAAPNAAALAALLWQKYPTATNAQIEAALKASAIDIIETYGTTGQTFTGLVGPDAYTGVGLIRAQEAITALGIALSVVNSAPVGIDTSIAAPQGTYYKIGFIDLYTDVNGNALDTLTVASVTTTTAAFTLNGTTVTAGQLIAGIDIENGLLRFVPNADATVTAAGSISFTVKDTGGTAGGGINNDLTANTLTFTVNPPNVAPSGTDATLTLAEDSTITLRVADFGFVDGTGDNDTLMAVTVAVPTAGTLLYNGQALTASRSVSVADLTAGLLTYRPVANANGATYANLTFQVQDNGGTAVGGIDLDPTPNRITFSVTAVNDAPTIAAATTVVWDQATLSTDDAYDISSQVQAQDFILTTGKTLTTFTVFLNEVTNRTNGVLEGFSGTLSWGVYSSVSGAPGALLFSGSDANPVMTDTGVNFADGTDIIRAVISLNNLTLGAGSYFIALHEGAWGSAYDSSQIYWELTSNDSSGTGSYYSAINGSIFTFFGADGLAFSLGTSFSTAAIEQVAFDLKNHFSVSDIDAGSGSITVTLGASYGIVTVAAGTSSVGTANNGTALVTLTGTVAQINDLLGANATSVVSFIANSDTPPASTTLTATVNDNNNTGSGGALSVSQSLVINILAVNDAPAGTDVTRTVAEDGSYTFAATNFGFTDPGDASADSFTAVTITTLPTSGTLKLGTNAVAAGQSIAVADIPTLTYAPAANFNGATAGTSFTFQVQDNGSTANGGVTLDASPNSFAFTVTPVNDAPTLADTSPVNLTLIYENQPSSIGDTVASLFSARLSDATDALASAGNPTGSSVNSFVGIALLTNPQASFFGHYQYNNGSGWIDTGGASTSAARTFAATTAIRYVPLPGETSAPSLSVVLIESGGPAIVDNAVVDFSARGGSTPYTNAALQLGQSIAAVNDAPTIAGLGGDSVGYTENASPVVLDAGKNSLLSDADSNDFNGGSLRVSITGNRNAAQDVLGIYTGDSVSLSNGTNVGSVVTIGSAVGTITSDGIGANDLVIAFNTGSATPATLSLLTRALTYANASDAPTTAARTISYTLIDGDGTAGGGTDTVTLTSTVTITALNDAPSGTDATRTLVTGGSLTFAAADFGFTDPRDVPANTLLAVKITTLPTLGTLKLGGTAVTVGQVVAAAAIPTLVYTPSAGGVGAGYASFTFQVQDNGGTANGGVDLDQSPNTITLDVRAANHAPAGTDAARTIVEDASYPFAVADFGFSDAGDSPADALAGVKIATLPIAGALTLSGAPVTIGQVVAAASIGQLVYAPAPNGNGAAYASFTFQVQDNGGTANGGVDTDPTPNMITFTVTAVDDAPVAVTDTAATPENVVLTGSLVINDTDIDGGPRTVATVNGVAGNVGAQFTLASGAMLTVQADGSYSYDPNGAFNYLVAAGSPTGGQSSATDTFTYALNGGSSATVTVTINGVDGTGDQIRGSAGADTLTGTNAADYFNISQGGADIVNAGGGNDTIFTGSGFSADDQIDGGPGTDQITLFGSYTGSLGNVINTEFMGFLSGTSVRFGGDGSARYSYDVTTTNATVAAGVAYIVQANELVAGENLRFDGSAELDGSFLIYAGKGIDTFIGGANNDGFFFGEGGRFTAADTVDGGAGNDQLGLRGNYTVTFGATTLTNVETIVLLSASDAGAAAQGAAYAYSLTLNDLTMVAGQVLRINAGQLRAGETASIVGSGETHGSFVFVGGAGNDSFTGGTGADTLYGGGGIDALTGGAGNDIFLYRAVGESTPGARDTITDFKAGDIIDLSVIDAIVGTPGMNDAFGFIDAGPFTDVAGQLRVTAVSPGNYLIEGDVDGVGGADFAINVTSDHTITTADFIL